MLVISTVSVPVFEVTAGTIAATPAAYYGSIVKVTAEAEDVLGPQAFTLDEDRVLAGPDVLVVAPRPPAAVPEGEELQVIGHVRPFITAVLQRDYDWFDPGWLGSAEVKLDERPVIVAASIVDAEGHELLSPPRNAQVKGAGTDAVVSAQNGNAATAELEPTKGNEAKGTVKFEPVSGGVRVVAELSGLKPGKHGLHVHEKGDCSAPDASSAGDHFNPTPAPHGSRDEKSAHIGDMGNIVANEDGEARLEYVDPHMALQGEKSILGKAVIVHAQADDLTTQPSGDSGARVGCGVVEPAV